MALAAVLDGGGPILLPDHGADYLILDGGHFQPMPLRCSDSALTEPLTLAPYAGEHVPAPHAEEQLKRPTIRMAQEGKPPIEIAQNECAGVDQTVIAASGRRAAYQDLVAPVPRQVWDRLKPC